MFVILTYAVNIKVYVLSSEYNSETPLCKAVAKDITHL